jgi:hypothetical protein
VFPDEILIRIAEELDRSTLFSLRTVSRSFLFAAKTRFKSEVLLGQFEGKRKSSMLNKLKWVILETTTHSQTFTPTNRKNPSRAALVRVLDAMDYDLSKREINLLSQVLPLLRNLEHLKVYTATAHNPLESLQPRTFDHLASLHIDASLSSFPKSFLEENSFPLLIEFHVSARWEDRNDEAYQAKMDEAQASIISFTMKHANQIRSVSFKYSYTNEKDLSIFITLLGDLPKIESFKVEGRWSMSADEKPSPLQVLLERAPKSLKEVVMAADRRMMGRPSATSGLPPLLQATPAHLPYLTSVKLGISFSISPVTVAWLQSLLPQLRTLWLSCTNLDEETVQRLFALNSFEAAEGTAAEVSYGTLRSLLLYMRYPEAATMNALAKRCPSVRIMILISEVTIKVCLRVS